MGSGGLAGSGVSYCPSPITFLLRTTSAPFSALMASSWTVPSQESLMGDLPCSLHPMPLVLRNAHPLCPADCAGLTPHHARQDQSSHSLPLPSPLGLHHLPQSPGGLR